MQPLIKINYHQYHQLKVGHFLKRASIRCLALSSTSMARFLVFDLVDEVDGETGGVAFEGDLSTKATCGRSEVTAAVTVEVRALLGLFDALTCGGDGWSKFINCC